MNQVDYNRKTVHPTGETAKYRNSAVTIAITRILENHEVWTSRIQEYYNKTIQYYLPECKETLVEEVDLGEAAESYMSLSHAEQEAIKQFIIALADSRDRK